MCLSNHVDQFGMIEPKTDLYILHKREKGVLATMRLLEVDDSLEFGTTAFLKIEDCNPRVFLSKVRQPLLPILTCFNGVDMPVKGEEAISMTQPMKIIRLEVPR